MAKKKIRIGDLLVQNKVISEEQLNAALNEQKKTGRKLGHTLVEMGYLEEEPLLNFLSEQLECEFVDLRTYQYDPDTIRKLPESLALRYRALLLDDSGPEALVGMVDPSDIFAQDEINRVLMKSVKAAVVREAQLLKIIDMVYRKTEEISNLASQLSSSMEDTKIELPSSVSAKDGGDSAPVAKLVESLFQDAVQIRASDVHIEPGENVLRIRQRIDGVLHEHIIKEHKIASALVLRLKLICGLDISEKRMPQNGRFQLELRGRKIDVRLSTMPMEYGESVVMRLLDQSANQLNLGQIGMPEDLLNRFRKALHAPNGIVLVTGPTGSGKTTTLYSALSELNKPSEKIITVEDPVEYRLPRICQVQVNEKIHLSFAEVLRACLRQDPDIIMIGEMRDKETVEIGMRAALTGHFVLSTLHTNDAVSTAIRLLDMGAEGHLVAAALRAVLAQRLVRRICQGCKEPYTPTPQDLAIIRHFKGDETVKYFHGAGCGHCNNTGYSGRVGVYELLDIDAGMVEALRTNNVIEFESCAARSKTYRPLAACALDYAEKGVTSIGEVRRLHGEVLDDDEPETETEAASEA